MAEKKRMANLELLRIIAMIMVVVMHFLRESGSLPGKDGALAGLPLSEVNVLAVFLEAFCIVAVNVYVLISGYFALHSSFRLTKVISFLEQIYFYAILIPLVLRVLEVPVIMDSMGIYGLVQYVLPVSSEHYWFATSYFYLLLLMPVINYAVQKLTEKQLSVVLVLLLTVFCGVKSICPIQLTMDKYGYDVLWFICLYLLGAWFSMQGEKVMTFMKKKALPLYLGSSLLIGGITIAFYIISGKLSGAVYYFTVPFHYNFVLCLTGAVGLFFVFGNLSVKEGKGADFIRKVSKYCFGVYLLHEHLDVRHYWYTVLGEVFGTGGETNIAAFFAEMIICVVVIFVAGICIDFIRNLCFDGISSWYNTKFGEKVRQIDDRFRVS